MIGAFLAAFLYQKTKNMALTALGEVVGTGIIGAIIAYPFALLFLGKNVALFAFVPSFIMSSFGGALLGYIFLRVLIKRNGIENLGRLNS
jgi:energy coupling factor transporter S component ThiW